MGDGTEACLLVQPRGSVGSLHPLFFFGGGVGCYLHSLGKLSPRAGWRMGWEQPCPAPHPMERLGWPWRRWPGPCTTLLYGGGRAGSPRPWPPRDLLHLVVVQTPGHVTTEGWSHLSPQSSRISQSAWLSADPASLWGPDLSLISGE